MASALRFLITAMLLALTAVGLCSAAIPAATAKHAQRAQLSIGYTLLYQEADGLPKLKWLLMFKDKPAEMGQVTKELVSFYQQLADTMKTLSKEHPVMRIDATAMSDIEASERKAIGEDLAKDFAPIVGKSGTEFEREALLMFDDSLNEQRHLVGVMVPLETNPALLKFLDTTKAELDKRYVKVSALLSRRYFTH